MHGLAKSMDGELSGKRELSEGAGATGQERGGITNVPQLLQTHRHRAPCRSGAAELSLRERTQIPATQNLLHICIAPSRTPGSTKQYINPTEVFLSSSFQPPCYERFFCFFSFCPSGKPGSITPKTPLGGNPDPPAAVSGPSIIPFCTLESTSDVTPGGRAERGVPAYRLPFAGCPAVRGALGEVAVPLRRGTAGRVTLCLLGCLRGAAVAVHGAALDAPAAGHRALEEGTEGEWRSPSQPSR